MFLVHLCGILACNIKEKVSPLWRPVNTHTVTSLEKEKLTNKEPLSTNDIMPNKRKFFSHESMTIDKPKGNNSMIFVIVGGILVALIVWLVVSVAMR